MSARRPSGALGLSDAHLLPGAFWWPAVLWLFAAGCATTVSDHRPAQPTWRAGDAAAAPAAGAAGKLAVYVAKFDLAPSVARRYPRLAAGQVGFGISNRIVEALYACDRFQFLEEKAEVAQRIAGLLRGNTPADPESASPREARWLIYGEIVDVAVARRESVAGLAGKTEVETAVTLQLRLLDRTTHRFSPATGSGSDVSREGGRHPGVDEAGELDERAVAAATDQAVRQAVAELLRRLDGR
jgi:hypothetical protein